METQKHKGCPHEWLIQAFIDGELEDYDNARFKQHILTCTICQERVAKRKLVLSNVMSKVNLIDNFHVRDQKHRILKVTAWSSIAASIIIALTVSFYQFKDKYQANSIDDCNWTNLSSNDFNPQLESPNRLFRMRVIEIKEPKTNGNTEIRYLVKQCNKN